ncbi:MAG TPA: TPM domain-containing protein, partial [Holophagaceae bacterium]|nr:TPM domain-containing protein [Holophagaceae bacterium]
MRLIRRLLRLGALALGLGVLSAGAGALAAQAPVPPAPDQFVTDRAGFLQEATREALSRRLEAVQRETGHQVIVYIQPSTGGEPVEDFAVRTFKAWGVGQKGLNDGAALFVFPQDRTLRIEVGYGLEDRLPDITCGRILREVITPAFRAGEPDRGVEEGVGAMLRAIGAEPGEAVPPRTRRQDGSNSPWGLLLFLGMAGFFLYLRI